MCYLQKLDLYKQLIKMGLMRILNFFKFLID